MVSGGTTSGTPQTKKAGAIIVAAGAGTRMDGVDKTLTPLAGIPLIARTVAVFEECPAVQSIVLVVAERHRDAARQLASAQGWRKVAEIAPGGPRRQDSVAQGMRALPPCEWVIVHDGARPLVDQALILRGLEAAGESGSAVAAVPAKDTIKVVGPDRRVQSTPDRRDLWLVQTPQVFRRELLERAHREVADDVTDDAAMVERLGLPVQVFMGSYRNLKVTTPDDLLLAEALLAGAGPEGESR